MVKGFILVDIPETCLDCKFCREVSEGIEAYCELELDLTDSELIRKIDVSYPQEKPDWCPIKELPKRLGLLDRMTQYDTDTHYEIGWNAYLDYLEHLGSKNNR